MKKRSRRLLLYACLFGSLLVQAQNDNDHPTTNFFGRTFFATGAQATANPFNLTVGLTPFNLATLNSRGDEMPVPDVFDPSSWCTFRSDMSDGKRQNSSMVRQEDDPPPTVDIEVGRLYHGSSFNWFAVQAPQRNGDLPGILWMENAETDGIMIRANGLQDPVNTYPLRCDGFASLGIRTDGTTGTQNMPSRARLQLVDVEGDVQDPWRPYYRNGTLFTGNQDMGYVGHRY